MHVGTQAQHGPYGAPVAAHGVSSVLTGRLRYQLGVPAGLARWDVKIWRPDDHPRDPLTGRFVRKPDGQIRYRRRPRHNGHKVSARTQGALSKARAALPRGDAWRSVAGTYVPQERRIDRRLRDERQLLDEYRNELAQAEAELEQEFRRKRTPKYKRDAIRKERLDEPTREVNLQTNFVRHLEELAADPNLTSRTDEGGPRWAEMVPERFDPNYPKDRNGVLIPPPELNRHLDTVLAVGEAIHNDFVDAQGRDPEITRLNGLKADLDGQLHEAKPEDRRALLRQRAGLNRHLAHREQEILLELLSSVRPLGGVRHGKATAATDEDMRRYEGGTKARTDWRSRLRAGERVFPDDWLRRSAGQPLQIGASQRAFHAAALTGGGSVLAMSDRTRDKALYLGGFRDETDEVTVHELGHRMEQTVPGLTALEFAYTRRRSMKGGEVERARQLGDLTGHSGFRDDERALPDEWAHPYAGKTYEFVDGAGMPNDADPASKHWEVFQVGLQDTFGRSDTHYDGVELQHFVLGVLASLDHGQQ